MFAEKQTSSVCVCVSPPPRFQIPAGHVGSCRAIAKAKPYL